MMSDNDWSPEAVMGKVNSLADSPGVTDRAKLEAIKVLMAQWKDQAQVRGKSASEPSDAERQELEDLIDDKLGAKAGYLLYAQVADAILAAGYRKGGAE